MVCEAANNQFSNSFEMKGQLENGLKLPAHNCDCVWVAKYENNNRIQFKDHNHKKWTF